MRISRRSSSRMMAGWTRLHSKSSSDMRGSRFPGTTREESNDLVQRFRCTAAQPGNGEEAVRHTRVVVMSQGDAGLAQARGITPTFVAQRVAVGGEDQGGRQAGQVRSQQRRNQRIARIRA